MISDKESVFIDVLINKIKHDPKTAFYANDILDHILVDWNIVENILNDTYRADCEYIELIDKKNQCKMSIPTFTSTWSHIPKYDPKFVFDKINTGHTLVILGSSKITSDVNQISYMIESIIPETSIDVHAYCGLKKSKSFKPHFDTVDNVIIHQTGKCHWKMFKQKAKDLNFERNVNETDLDIEFECDIGPGDFLYVPKEQYHECIPLEKRISLSFPMAPQKNSIDRTWYKINEY